MSMTILPPSSQWTKRLARLESRILHYYSSYVEYSLCVEYPGLPKHSKFLQYLSPLENSEFGMLRVILLTIRQHVSSLSSRACSPLALAGFELPLIYIQLKRCWSSEPFGFRSELVSKGARHFHQNNYYALAPTLAPINILLWFISTFE